MTQLRHLLESIRQGARPPLSVEEVELLLGWLTGSAAREVANGTELPNPAHDPVLLQMVLFRLDDELFDGGELRPAAAGLETSEPATRRRIRFRRLASAFHPDRFPDLADWLTQRSQAVHRAYARFKQDPDASVLSSSPFPPSPSRPAAKPGQDMRRAQPRVRKHRIRALANRLRARFGHDRYLAHKLIGGLALLALLPVLNMVLVPVSGPDETLYGSRLTVVEDEPVSGFRFPVSGEDQDAAVGDSLQVGVGAGNGGDESAQDAPPTTGRTADGTADELTANELADDNASQPTSQLANQRTSEPVEDAGTGYDRTEGGTGDSVGAGSSRDDRALETQIAASQAEAAEAGNLKPSPSTSDLEISPLLAAARRAMNPNGEIATAAALQTVDEQLAAMGLANDTERLYRRIGGEEKPVSGFRVPVSGEDPGGAAPGSGEDSVEAGSGRDDRATESRIAASPAEATANEQPARKPETGNLKPAPAAPSARDAPPTTSRTAELASGEADSAVGAGSSRDDRATESRVAASSAEGSANEQPARKPETGNPKPAPATRDDSELALGPLATHPAGEVLKRLHEALAAGNIPGVAGTFTPDAQMHTLRGRDQIAHHFRVELNPADSRSVNLKVLRLGRGNGGWRIEADLDVRVDRDGETRTLVSGRSNFWLAEQGNRLLITRMDSE